MSDWTFVLLVAFACYVFVAATAAAHLAAFALLRWILRAPLFGGPGV